MAPCMHCCMANLQRLDPADGMPCCLQRWQPTCRGGPQWQSVCASASALVPASCSAQPVPLAVTLLLALPAQTLSLQPYVPQQRLTPQALHGGLPEQPQLRVGLLDSSLGACMCPALRGTLGLLHSERPRRSR